MNTHDLLVAVGWALILALPITLVGSWLLVRLYRRSVTRLMRTRGSGAPGPLPGQRWRTALFASVQEPAFSGAVKFTQSAHIPIERLAARATRAACAIQAIAGLAGVAVAATWWLRTSGVEFGPYRLTALTLAAAFPAVLTASSAGALEWKRTLLLAAGYFAAYFATFAVASANAAGTFSSAASLWAICSLPTALCACVLLVRALRAVGVLLFATAVLVTLSAYGLALRTLELTPLFVFSLIGQAGVLAPLAQWVFRGLLLVVAGAGGIIAAAVLWLAVRAAYRRKWLSDDGLAFDALWFLHFGIMGGAVAVSGGLLALPAFVTSFGLYKVLALLGQRRLLHFRLPTARPPRLLFLRSFSASAHWERLFHAFAQHWRYVGTIELITGHDLASSTVEPHELLDYVTGRLKRHFIADATRVEDALKALDERRDPDGRFRINELLCSDDVWELAFQRLALDSDVVLVHLHGLQEKDPSQEKEMGLRAELRALARHASFDRVVLVGGDPRERARAAEMFAEGAKGRQGERSVRLGPYVVQPGGARASDVRELLRVACGAAVGSNALSARRLAPAAA